ncbi:MAG: hypothetical protein NTZ74_12475 [Chloroflexi bacterium]|nr:hypothetical protein [Chloroflexota bacterium]
MDLKFVLLVFGIVFLIVLLTRKAIVKVKKDRETRVESGVVKSLPQKPKFTEEQFNRSWKSLSYLLLLAAAGNLYMVYTAIGEAFATGSVILWIDAVFSLAAAVAAVLIWRFRNKKNVYFYFIFTMVPIIMFMSIQGSGPKQKALIHLFPLVLLYFVLKPIWESMKE